MLLKRNKYVIFVLLVFAGCILVGHVHASSTWTSSESEICRFAVPPWQKGLDFNEVKQEYLPLMRYLSKETGCQFVAVGARDYDDLVEKISTGKVMMAELGAVTYVKSQQINPGVKLVSVILSEDRETKELTDHYYSYVLSRKDNPAIKSLSDLKGQSFGFVSKTSSSGYVYPYNLLKKSGYDADKYFGEIFFLGSHSNVTDAIASGSIKAGATMEYNFKLSTRKHGDIYRVLWKSPQIPNILFASSSNMPDSIRSKLTEILPGIEAEKVKLPKRIKGFINKDDAFYDVTRNIMQ